MTKQDNDDAVSGGSGLTDPTTTKGDIIVNNGSITTRLAIGSNDQVLTADSGEATGVKWATASGGGGATTGSFSYSNNISSASNITGLVFDKASIRGADIFVTTFTDSTFGDKATVSTIHCITDGTNWGIIEDTKQSTVATNITYSITSAGQFQYTSPNDGGFTTGTMKWSYFTTAV